MVLPNDMPEPDSPTLHFEGVDLTTPFGAMSDSAKAFLFILAQYVGVTLRDRPGAVKLTADFVKRSMELWETDYLPELEDATEATLRVEEYIGEIFGEPPGITCREEAREYASSVLKHWFDE